MSKCVISRRFDGKQYKYHEDFFVPRNLDTTVYVKIMWL